MTIFSKLNTETKKGAYREARNNFIFAAIPTTVLLVLALANSNSLFKMLESINAVIVSAEPLALILAIATSTMLISIKSPSRNILSDDERLKNVGFSLFYLLIYATILVMRQKGFSPPQPWFMWVLTVLCIPIYAKRFYSAVLISMQTAEEDVERMVRSIESRSETEDKQLDNVGNRLG
jgi:hypothetical protein